MAVAPHKDIPTILCFTDSLEQSLAVAGFRMHVCCSAPSTYFRCFDGHHAATQDSGSTAHHTPLTVWSLPAGLLKTMGLLFGHGAP